MTHSSNIKPDSFSSMSAAAGEAATLLKSLSHEGRLLLLCQLAEGERSVGELTQALDLRQASISQQLARLRAEGVVATRKEGQNVYYRLHDDRARQVIELIHSFYCPLIEKS